MCYNKTYAQKIPTVGDVVVSRMGHDTGKPYMIIASPSPEFVLCADGRGRTLEKPKLKRIKHVKRGLSSAEAAAAIADKTLTDESVRRILKTYAGADPQQQNT